MLAAQYLANAGRHRGLADNALVVTKAENRADVQAQELGRSLDDDAERNADVGGDVVTDDDSIVIDKEREDGTAEVVIVARPRHPDAGGYGKAGAVEGDLATDRQVGVAIVDDVDVFGWPRSHHGGDHRAIDLILPRRSEKTSVPEGVAGHIVFGRGKYLVVVIRLDRGKALLEKDGWVERQGRSIDIRTCRLDEAMDYLAKRGVGEGGLIRELAGSPFHAVEVERRQFEWIINERAIRHVDHGEVDIWMQPDAIDKLIAIKCRHTFLCRKCRGVAVSRSADVDVGADILREGVAGNDGRRSRFDELVGVIVVQIPFKARLNAEIVERHDGLRAGRGRQKRIDGEGDACHHRKV